MSLTVRSTHKGKGQAAPVPAEDGALEQVLTFRLEGERFGIGIGDIVEILKYRPATPVPLAPPVVHGIISLRGRIITVLDSRIRLDMPPVQGNDGARIIVVRRKGEQIGLLVDEVLQVVKLSVHDIEAPPSSVTRAGDKGIRGVCDTRHESILILLDVQTFTETA